MPGRLAPLAHSWPAAPHKSCSNLPATAGPQLAFSSFVFQHGTVCRLFAGLPRVNEGSPDYQVICGRILPEKGLRGNAKFLPFFARSFNAADDTRWTDSHIRAGPFRRSHSSTASAPRS